MKFEYYSNVDPDTTYIQVGVAKMLREDLKQFAGKRVRITLQRATGKRSLQQNALFHMYVGIIAKHLGYTESDGAEEMKEIIKYKFCKAERVDTQTGEMFTYIKPTHLHSKLEFITLIDSVIKWAAEQFKLALPNPALYGYGQEDA